MVRSWLQLLLIANLLACPGLCSVQCCAAEARGVDGGCARVAQSCCRCCEQCERPGEPVAPPTEEDGRTCLCAGALAAKHDAELWPEAQWAVAACTLPELPAAAPGRPVATTHDLSPLPTGRALRTLLGSLLL